MKSLQKEKSEANNDASCRRTLRDISIQTLVLKAILFYSAPVLGGYLLWNKSLPIFLAYSIILIVTIIGFRYPICGRCYYYGKPCPSYGFSYLATLFPKVEGKEVVPEQVSFHLRKKKDNSLFWEPIIINQNDLLKRVKVHTNKDVDVCVIQVYDLFKDDYIS